MAEVVLPPDRVITTEYSIFLAGAIDMGAAVDWQSWVIDQLAPSHHMVIYNPRRAAFTPDTLDEQIEWELEVLENVDRIFMWFPREAKAPISFLETGLYLKSGKLIIGAEPGFYRRRNLEMTTARYGVELHDSLQSMLEVFKRMGFEVA